MTDENLWVRKWTTPQPFHLVWNTYRLKCLWNKNPFTIEDRLNHERIEKWFRKEYKSI